MTKNEMSTLTEIANLKGGFLYPVVNHSGTLCYKLMSATFSPRMYLDRGTVKALELDGLLVPCDSSRSIGYAQALKLNTSAYRKFWKEKKFNWHE